MIKFNPQNFIIKFLRKIRIIFGKDNPEKIRIRKTGNIEGVLNQKTLMIEEGAVLKIKTETHK